MKLLLDTHILLALLSKRLAEVSPITARALEKQDVWACASVASLWEIAIKVRLGKLDSGMPLDLLPEAIEALGMTILPITPAHALCAVDPVPPTRDPFDRMLLAQCQVEACRLATLDHALRNHPLAANVTDPATTGSPRSRP